MADNFDVPLPPGWAPPDFAVQQPPANPYLVMLDAASSAFSTAPAAPPAKAKPLVTQGAYPTTAMQKQADDSNRMLLIAGAGILGAIWILFSGHD